MVQLIQSFIHSIKLPKKTSVFYLNRIGMDIAVIYLFILLIFASTPSFVDQIIHRDTFGSQMNVFFFFIYFFIFYYLILNIIVFSVISGLAYGWMLIARSMKRKLRFAILWKMVTYSTTIPILLFTILSFKFSVHYLFLVASFIFINFILLKIVLIYPRRKHFKGKSS